MDRKLGNASGMSEHWSISRTLASTGRRAQNRLVLTLVFAFLATTTQAREAVVGMNERVLKQINEVQELIDDEDYDDALEELEGMNRRRLSSYETAHVLNIEGYIYFQQGDAARAQQSYEGALAQERLPNSMLANLRLTLGRLGLMQENFDYALGHLRALLSIPDQDKPSNRVLLANAYFGKNEFRAALGELDIALDRSRARGEKPRENWLGLLAAVYYELEDFESMRDVTYELAVTYPRQQHFMNLAALYGQLGDQKRQLALVESLMEQGRLSSEQHLKLIANLYMAQDLPYKAARLLETELDSGRIEADVQSLELLSQAWYGAARVDKAIPPLEEAAKMAEDGEVYVRVARLYLDAYDWENAARATREALRKGELRDEGNVWLIQGMALARMSRWGDAAETFARAAQFEESARYAEQWIAYVDSEREREAAL